ncbi:uncharacterized protein PRCAT00000359001 [Priceomyces carsonii]|uniref:uncharacterized protein n=1 Tax=Priceomyces carsonii TaxID=28549 RepID=UPI002EDA7D20|nr:unnamed protein product [Priceomyces carsonii]
MSNLMKNYDEQILYRQVKSLKSGQIHRFKIEYTPLDGSDSVELPPNLWLKVKNKEMIAMRAAYLAGPYVLYVDCKSDEYDLNKKCFVTADQPTFEPQLLPGQSFYNELSCHTLKDKYVWTIDVISQIVFNNTIDVDFEIMLGTSKRVLHEASIPEKKVPNYDRIGSFIPNSILNVTTWDTLDLWNLPIPDHKKPIHLVILTHGLHSNISTDMLYLKEQIDKIEDNIVVKGFFGNIGKTERGIKYLGSRVAEYIIDLVSNDTMFNNGKVGKVSFIGHSLGGLVQTFAIAYIQNNFLWFFKTIQPINFITLASPMLGVVNENPLYVKIALLAGIVGKTGQDLGLKFLEKGSKPLLLLLPTGPTHQALKMFSRRTVYANVINDGVVPLRTSALLFLDYKGLNQVINSKDNKVKNLHNNSTVGEIPAREEGALNDSFLPVQAMLSYFMPQKHKRKPNHRYQKYQTTTNEDSQVLQKTNDEGTNFDAPRSSVLETATSLILPPLPTPKYINDPESRPNVIFHDKVYQESDIPSKEQSSQKHNHSKVVSPKTDNSNAAQSSGIKKRIMNSIDSADLQSLEEQIAREYHKNMKWRKVLVKLKPDAHNNIIVRRRFANAYGWPVIEHLVQNHFALEINSDEDNKLVSNNAKMRSSDSLDKEQGLSAILSRDTISQEIGETEKNEDDTEENDTEACEHHWINSEDNGESIFAVGPTGLLSDVSEMVGNLRNLWHNHGLFPPEKVADDLNNEELNGSVPGKEIDSESNDLGAGNRLMGEFI